MQVVEFCPLCHAVDWQFDQGVFNDLGELLLTNSAVQIRSFKKAFWTLKEDFAVSISSSFKIYRFTDKNNPPIKVGKMDSGVAIKHVHAGFFSFYLATNNGGLHQQSDIYLL